MNNPSENLLAQLNELANLSSKATPGPWMPAPIPHNSKYRVYPQFPNYGNPKPLYEPSNHLASAANAADAAFIAAARNLLTPENLTLLVAALAGPVVGWIAVADELPETAWNNLLSYPVFVCGLGFERCIRHYEPGAEAWYDAAHGTSEPRRYYSHWMPLPTRPADAAR